LELLTPAAVTHIDWPLNATRKSKPAKECACPARKKKFSKMPHARLKRLKETLKQTDKYGILNRLTLWTEKQQERKARCPNKV
jgi:hypothetical protein